MKSAILHLTDEFHRHSNLTVSLLIISIFLFTSFLLNNQNAYAQLICPQRGIEQITDEPSGDSDDSSISANGLWIAFESQADIGGGNPDGQNDIFLADTITGIIEQITAVSPGAASEPAVNRDGTLVAFDATADLIGGGPPGNAEIFLFNATTGIFTQITFTTSGGNLDVAINADGTHVAFSSDANVLGPNLIGNFEIYIYEIATGIITQVTNTASGASRTPSLNADGTLVAFRSNADIVGVNDGGNNEIYIYNITNGTFSQITSDPSASSVDPNIDANGNVLAFKSNGNFTGENPDGNDEVFLVDIASGAFSQITNNITGDSEEPAINADGTRIAFRSSANINGGNPEGNAEIYLFDTTTGITTQITNEPSGLSRDPSIDASGLRISFDSDADINGGNPEGNEEIYLAICRDLSVSIPTLSEWGLMAMASILGIAGFMVIRRRNAVA